MRFKRQQFPGRAMFIIALLLILISGTCDTRRKTAESFEGLKLFSSLPLSSDEGKILYTEDSIEIWQHGPLVLHKFFVPITRSKMTIDNKGEILSEKNEIIGVKYKYFVYHQDSLFGRMFDTVNVKKYTRLSVGDVLSGNSLTSLQSFVTTITTDVKLVDSGKTADKNTTVLKFVPNLKSDASYPDSINLYFSKALNEIDFFTFSKPADSARNSKLFKLELVFNPNPASTDVFGKLEKKFMFRFQKLDTAPDNAVRDLLKSAF